MRSPPGVFSGLGVVRGGTCHDGGGSARRCSSACQRSGAWGALRATLTGQKEGAGRGDPHRARNWTERCRKEAGDDVTRRRSGRSSGTSRCRASPGVWAARRDSWLSCGGPTGIREARGSPAVRNRGGGTAYRRCVPGEIPGAGVTRSGAKELEDAPVVEAEPVRSLDRAQVRRGGGNPAAQSLAPAWRSRGDCGYGLGL